MVGGLQRKELIQNQTKRGWRSESDGNHRVFILKQYSEKSQIHLFRTWNESVCRMCTSAALSAFSDDVIFSVWRTSPRKSHRKPSFFSILLTWSLYLWSLALSVFTRYTNITSWRGWQNSSQMRTQPKLQLITHISHLTSSQPTHHNFPFKFHIQDFFFNVLCIFNSSYV